MLVLHKLRKTSSRIEKELILKSADTFEKKVFQYTYNPDLTFGIKYNYIDWKTVRQPEQIMFVILDKLAKRELTGNAARDEVEHYAEQHGDLIKLICNKDLDCGVTATTLNKVFGKGFVPQFKVQLATEVAIEDCPLPIIGQIKYNGVRVIAFITNKSVKFRTRNGKFFEYPELKEKLLKAHEYCPGDYVLDGELTFGDSSNSDHTQVSGLVNSAIHGSPIRQTLIFNVFDGMSIETFMHQKDTLQYGARFDTCKTIVEKLDENIVRLAETYEFYTHNDIQNKFDKMLAKGFEGLILKSWQHKYSFKRSKDWIKLKAIKTADLKCTGYIEGTGKYQGGIGALCCEAMVEGKWVEVNVGSGLSDADRFADPVDYEGNMIEVKYNTIIQDAVTGQWSLFLPRFVTIRGDL